MYLAVRAQHLMSRRTRSVLPVMEKQLRTKVIKTSDIEKQLSFNKEQQQRNYDVGSKVCQFWNEETSLEFKIRIKGSPKAVVLNEAEHPR